MSQMLGQFENFRSRAQRVTRIAKRDHNARYLLAEPAKIADTIRSIAFSRYSPDESQTGINVRVFSALLQERREVRTATMTAHRCCIAKPRQPSCGLELTPASD